MMKSHYYINLLAMQTKPQRRYANYPEFRFELCPATNMMFFFVCFVPHNVGRLKSPSGLCHEV